MNSNIEPQEFSDKTKAGESARLDCELASRGDRLIAIVLDYMIIGIPFVLFVVAFRNYFSIDPSPSNLMRQIILIIAIATGLFWFVDFSINGYLLKKRGQSIGKVIMKIRIIKLDGAVPGLLDSYVKRRVFVQVVSLIPNVGFIFAIVDVLFVFRRDKRCIHDLLAGTVVEKMSKPLSYQINEIRVNNILLTCKSRKMDTNMVYLISSLFFILFGLISYLSSWSFADVRLSKLFFLFFLISFPGFFFCLFLKLKARILKIISIGLSGLFLILISIPLIFLLFSLLSIVIHGYDPSFSKIDERKAGEHYFVCYLGNAGATSDFSITVCKERRYLLFVHTQDVGYQYHADSADFIETNGNLQVQIHSTGSRTNVFLNVQ